MVFRKGQLVTKSIRLREPLGAGGMGAVWVADHLTLETRVAVKFISNSNAKSIAVERFRREATLAAKIQSPHVVQIFDHGVMTDGTPYIVMELMAGTSLETRLTDGPLDLAATAEVVSQLGKALSAAHKLDIVHRDIKPANIFLVESEGYDLFVKVLDFGIAKQRRPRPSDLTSDGALMGTPRYMSPEQLMSTRDVGRSADLWAMAVVAYEMLTGHAPFEGATTAALFQTIASCRFQPPSTHDATIPNSLDAWFARSFHVDEAHRYNSAEEAAVAFGRLASDVVGLGSQETLEASAVHDDGNEPTDAFVERVGIEAPIDEHAETDTQLALPTEGAPDARTKARRRTVALAAAMSIVAAAVAWAWPSNKPATPRPTSSSLRPTASVASVIATASAPPSPAPTGSLESVELAEHAWRQQMPTFIRCWSADGDPTRAAVRTVEMRIDATGTVKSADIAEVTTTPKADACIRRAAKWIMFPPQAEPTTLSYALFFANDVPLDDRACRESVGCLRWGNCTAEPKGCVAGKDADCQHARVCSLQGECVMRGGRCAVGFDDCAENSDACKNFGLCDKRQGICVASTDGCNASNACKTNGLCRADAGICKAVDDATCRASAACQSLGLCTRRGRWCAAASHEDCAASKYCRVQGLCRLRAGRCVATRDEDCKASAECLETGRCVASPAGTCRATEDDDCRASKACKERGECHARDGYCAAD